MVVGGYKAGEFLNSIEIISSNKSDRSARIHSILGGIA
jgi:hypothetical protein